MELWHNQSKFSAHSQLKMALETLNMTDFNAGTTALLEVLQNQSENLKLHYQNEPFPKLR